MNTSSEDIIVCAQTIGLAHEVIDVIVLDNDDEHNRHTVIDHVMFVQTLIRIVQCRIYTQW